MTLASINSLILASALAIAPFTANAFTANESDNAHRDNVIQLSVDANGNYHISFDTAELTTSTAAQENQDLDFHRSSVVMRVNGVPTTTEDRINGFVNAVKYFTNDSPRSFSLTPSPNKERMDTEEYGEVQHYDFCVYFNSALRSTSCSYIWFSVDEMNLISRLGAAEIKYERIDKASDISGGPDNYG